MKFEHRGGGESCASRVRNKSGEGEGKKGTSWMLRMGGGHNLTPYQSAKRWILNAGKNIYINEEKKESNSGIGKEFTGGIALGSQKRAGFSIS